MGRSDTSLLFWIAFLNLQERSTRDWLTGLYNRHYFEETLSDHIESARRYERKLSLVLFDIDGFKQLNDTAGHGAGDEALRQFAETLKAAARKADIVCRYGGDEFTVILPETGRGEATVFSERIQAASEISVSAGISALPSDNLFAEADTHLLEEKQRRPA